MRPRMRWTSLAFASARSGFGSPRSAKTFPLPASTPADRLVVLFFRPLFLFEPFRIVPFCLLQPALHLFDLFGRGLDSALRLLLECVTDIDDAGNLPGVPRAVGVPVIVLTHSQNACPAEALEGLGVRVLAAGLGVKQCLAESHANRLRELPQVLPARGHPV